MPFAWKTRFDAKIIASNNYATKDLSLWEEPRQDNLQHTQLYVRRIRNEQIYLRSETAGSSLPSLGYSKKQVFRNRAWFIAHMTYACKSRPVAFTNYKRCLVSLRINMHTTRDTGSPETREMNITAFKLTSLTVCSFFPENHWYCCVALDFGGSALNQKAAQKSYIKKSKVLLNSRGL